MIELVLPAAALAAISAYRLGRYVELRRWHRQREHVGAVLDAARARITELQVAEESTLSIVREQRDLLDTFAQATETLYQRNDDEAWRSLSWACHRARTELL